MMVRRLIWTERCREHTGEPLMHANWTLLTGTARRIACAVVVIALAVILRAVNAADGGANEFAVGADLSSMAQAERNGPVFKENGQTKLGLALFKDHGYKWIRLR